ncbi:hypothetical protein EJ06DRAFT_529151 [Trichodelitschia bisporula]|uniref:Uncharacterized protein n=1 Tax=Trichodelitschia bisporula TaxID=703511 RepID=A0A6G1I1S2_9PEZI|nr:hypothetical protein EJ06DRAFT_529151 [Trichodelitschia bisporula]
MTPTPPSPRSPPPHIPSHQNPLPRCIQFQQGNHPPQTRREHNFSNYITHIPRAVRA